MDDELENFLRDRKARVAEDRASLQPEPKSRPQRTYATKVKENIPPKVQAQEAVSRHGYAYIPEKESSVGLPLGLEYEKKKQKLQRELRMDFRHYITQKLLDRRTPLVSNIRPPSVIEDVVAPSTGDPRDGFVRRVDLESDGTRSATEFTRRTQRWNNWTDSEKRDVMFGRRSRAARNGEEEEFTTGLNIGAADTEEVARKKKESYRKELLEQIAEKVRSKKRERELELNVAATGANDPEKAPDRIREFGLRRRRPADSANVAAAADKATPATELPRVAFQSPILDYSAALDLGPGRHVSSAATDTPSFSQAPPPHAPSARGDHRSPPHQPPHQPPHERPHAPPYDPPYEPSPRHEPSLLEPSPLYELSPLCEPPPPHEPPPREPPPHHQHFHSRNPLEPQSEPYGHLPAGGQRSYWIPPPGGAPGYYGNQSPPSGRGESSFREPQPRAFHVPPNETRTARERELNYREELRKQMEEQQERRRMEQQEIDRYEARLEEDMKRHHPWGRGGGGAPLRDSTGNLIANLTQMHKLNVEAYNRPEQRRAAQRRPGSDPNQRVNGTVSVCSDPDTSDGANGFTHVQAPLFARGGVLPVSTAEQQLQKQVDYKAELKLQIDEKMRKKAEEMERIRLEDEKEEKRLAEQRASIQKAFEEDEEKRKRKYQQNKEENLQEALKRREEERKEREEEERKEREEEERKEREEEERRREEEERRKKEEESEARRRLQERDGRTHQTEVGEPSPPIPTLQKKPGPSPLSPRPPTVDTPLSVSLTMERSLSGMQSPPVPARRNQLRAAEERRDVFSELSALRRRLKSEQKRLESSLQQDRDWDLESPLSDRHRERPQVDVFDMARLKIQAPVRRPSPRSTEPKNLLQIHDSLQLKYNDTEFSLVSGVSKSEAGAGGWRLRDFRDFRDLDQFNSQRSTVQGDYLDFSPTHPHDDDLRSTLGGSSRCSLLESESAFIEPLGEVFSTLPSPEQKKVPLSARERRRKAKAQDVSPAHEDDRPPQTGTGLQQEQSRSRNHRNTAGTTRRSPW
ncbi:centrosome and spindle pole-associated protein 1-like [Eucyclogobius newberryi]|uniref:centrosome and spindle pole-associated protein 1-like n=1 Tax=Eucyclogobius newberryi TaxID=166745 RepID=UPI003B597222